MKKNYLKGISLIDLTEQDGETTNVETVDEINLSQYFVNVNKKSVKTEEPETLQTEK